MMKKRKLIPDPVLMLLSILGIAAFQLFWLKQSYDREKKSLFLKTEAAFRQSVQRLQAEKLKLGSIATDSLLKGSHRLVVKTDSLPTGLLMAPPNEENLVTAINVIHSKVQDSLMAITGGGKKMVFSISEKTTLTNGDSVLVNKRVESNGSDRFIQLLYGMDSLQEKLRKEEIDSALGRAFLAQQLDIPYRIKEVKGSIPEPGGFNASVSLGFARPVTFGLQLGNTMPYLLKKILLPILFSILLLGITILAFYILYRNMLRQRRLTELKNDFISNITHELKTPIATAGVAIEALKNFNAIRDPERTKEYLDISAGELQRLSLMVDKVLQLSAFEHSEMELRLEEFSLAELVDETLVSLKPQLEKTGARVAVNYSGNLQLMADRLQLQSVIFNLLDNALKYARGKPVIRIGLEEKGPELELVVADEGMGIAPEYRDKVFEKFFRVPRGDTHNAKGYGLGLSYVAQVVRRHGGRIGLQSQPGKGAEFLITLPKKLI